jgi:hypothetical protein
MAYTPILLDTAVPSEIDRFVRGRVEPYLRDVRLMLEFPKVQDQPGFNLTAAGALCGVMGGIARVFDSTTRPDGDSFRGMAKRYATIDVASAVPNAEKFADQLYEVYRCTLVHALGLNTNWNVALKRWKVEPLSVRTKVTRWDPLPMTEVRLLELERGGAWPATLPATLSLDGGVERLNVDAFYCGIRRLVKSLAEDASLHSAAVTILSDWLRPGGTVQPSEQATMSSTNVVMSTVPMSADATLGAIPASEVVWPTKPVAEDLG